MPDLFHKPGVVWFWFLNDACETGKLDAFVDAFAESAAAGVVLHARPGGLMPYGGSDWFDMIRHIVERCAAKGLAAWLYDEDPYPSGACGGILTHENPNRQARAIYQHIVDPDLQTGELFGFPIGELLWCGAVRESDGGQGSAIADGDVLDFTARVGTVRREWMVFEDANSSNYYPCIPAYDCIRSDTFTPEFALKIPELPAGYVLHAYVARPCGKGAVYGDQLPDLLNPELAQEFIRRTHDRYYESVGQWFGNTIPAIFTDEPKYFGSTPWTAGIGEDFAATYGYDLLPRLWHLYSPRLDPELMKTRLDYREWCGHRFREVWLKPVSDWCHDHGIALTGHISPEDDPPQQAVSVSNLFSCFPYFTIPGIDLIVPAVGDRRHALLNIGVVSATSSAQQNNRPGVMSETLACSGLDSNVEIAALVLRWQLVMGVTTHVIHGAFNSVEGERLYDAPPDWGPQSDHWPGMVELGRELADLQSAIRDAAQIAPVAILWPIRSYAALSVDALEVGDGWRDQLVELLRRCLDQQSGVHFIDEADLCRATIADGHIKLGRAIYSHILIPDCLILAASTIQALREAAIADVSVVGTGTSPAWIQTETGIEPAGELPWKRVGLDDVMPQLPRLVIVDGDTTDIRCTAWERNGEITRLLININDKKRDTVVDGKTIKLPRGKVVVL